MRKIFSALIFIFALLAAQNFVSAQSQLNYQAHVQDYGWLPAVYDGGVAGTVGQHRRMEAVLINLMDGTRSMIRYCGHVQNIGWQGWQISGGIAGTTGKNLRLEAVRIELLGAYAKNFDIYYRTHVENGGWLGWAKNGEPAGTQGASLRMEALQIKIVPKGSNFNRGGAAFYQKNNYVPMV